jgi:hypothetical protein
MSKGLLDSLRILPGSKEIAVTANIEIKKAEPFLALI